MAKFCGVCDDEITQGETWDGHNASDRHQNLQRQRECCVELEVQGGWHEATRTHLLSIFQEYGPIVKITMTTRGYPLAGLGEIEFATPISLQKVLQQTYYRLSSRGVLIKVTRWLSNKKRQANAELEERERSLYAEKDRGFQDDIYNAIKLAALTDQQINQLSWMQQLTPTEVKMAAELRSDIETIIQTYIPEGKVHLIGSTNNGLAVRGCDMNFEVTFDPRARRPASTFLPDPPPLPENLVQQTYFGVVHGRVDYESFRQTRSFQAIWFLYEILSKSNLTLKLSRLELHVVPPDLEEEPRHNNYITFMYLKMQAECELHIKMSESLSCYTTELTSLLTKLDERVRSLYLAVRYWARKSQIFENVRSGVLFLLVYHYLQNVKPPVLPSVETLLSMTGTSQTKVRGCQVAFCEDLVRIKRQCLPTSNSQTLSELLQGFFKYYCRYDLTNRVFCPHSGKAYNVLKFRNMKKLVPALSRFEIANRFVHIQHLFRQDFNEGEKCSRAAMHLICAELARAEVLTRTAVSTWNLLSLVPEETINHNLKTKVSPRHIRIPFISACLPEGFLGYESYAEAESQWYQLIAEIAMKCLKILRITYTLEGDYGVKLQQNGNKRQMIEDAAARKRRGHWSTLQDEDRAQDFSKTYHPTYDVIQESTLICEDAYNLWRTRARRFGSSSTAWFIKEEAITVKQLEEFHKFKDRARLFKFSLTISHVKSVNETLVDIFGAENGSTYSYNAFIDFFQEFFVQKVCQELGLEIKMFDLR